MARSGRGFISWRKHWYYHACSVQWRYIYQEFMLSFGAKDKKKLMIHYSCTVIVLCACKVTHYVLMFEVPVMCMSIFQWCCRVLQNVIPYPNVFNNKLVMNQSLCWLPLNSWCSLLQVSLLLGESSNSAGIITDIVHVYKITSSVEREHGYQWKPGV